METPGHHVLRQFRARAIAQPLVLLVSFYERFHSAITASCHWPSDSHNRIRTAMLAHHGLDFAKLHAMPQHFDLRIDAAQMDQRSSGYRPTDAIARSVVHLGLPRRPRERLRSFLRIAPITK